MKHKNKKAAAAALVFALLLCTFSASASITEPLEKEEVVYASLGMDGSVSGVYVVNSFELDEDTVVTDHGQYSSVVNLTNNSEINYSSGTVSVEAEKGMFWYQGNMDDAELPWNIAIEYLFDGEKTDSPAGKSGAMELKILTFKNENASGTFFDDYTLQITVTLDTAFCSHIEAPAGTVAASGNDKIINFVGMAGSDGEFIITADVTDFEMASITIAGVVMDMSSFLEDFDLSSVTEQFSQQFAQLSQGIAQLDDGAGQLAYGISQYAAGVADYADGVEQVTDGITQIDRGAAELEAGAVELSSGMAALEQGIAALSANGTALNAGASALVDSAFASANVQLADYALALGADFTLTPENYSSVLNTIRSAMPELSSQLDQVQAQLDGIIQFSSSVASYTSGVSGIAAGISQTSAGLDQYSVGVSEFADGTSQLSQNAGALAQGAAQLTAGAQQISDGAAEYKAGTALMRESTNSLDKTMEDNINSITEDLITQPGPVCSFTSEENTRVGSVQFVMRTAAVTAEAPPTVDDDPQPLTFWQKLLALFGL